MSTDRCYLDHAASTPMRPEAIAAMQPYLAQHCGNPSGSHAAARATKTALEDAREIVAHCLGAHTDEIVFTGGGSEGDNLAVKGAAWAAAEAAGGATGLGVVTTAIEHKAVLGAVHRLAGQGFAVAEVRATLAGTVDMDMLAAALDARTAVVSVMLVNNETGTVQPLDDVATLVAERAPHAVLHTDAVQAPQWIDLAATPTPAHLLAVSGHKFGGPKGVGALVARRGTRLVPLIEGGGHEWGLRAGTQNVPGIVAFAAALRATHEARAEERERIGSLRDCFERTLMSAVDGVAVNGDMTRRVAGISHVAIDGVEAEELLVALDHAGVDAASGSACSSGATEPSHVLVAMGMEHGRARASVRFSFGWASSADDAERAAALVAACVQRLRAPVAG